MDGVDLREKLAELCHEQWSGWMKYLFSKCNDHPAGTGALVMPAWAVERWRRQMNTPYRELSEPEQDSDRTEADRFLDLLKQQQGACANCGVDTGASVLAGLAIRMGSNRFCAEICLEEWLDNQQKTKGEKVA